MTLWGEMFRFAAPEAFWLLALLVPVALWSGLRRRGRAAVRYSSLGVLHGVPRSLRARLRFLGPTLRVLGVAALVVALARPQQGYGETTVTAEGVAIMAVVDRSWSMTQEIDFDGERLSRIDVVKRVFREFVEGNGDDLPGRPHDLIGLVSFARYAQSVSPLSRSHGILTSLVDSISLVDPRRDRFEAGTAIGEGLSLAAARLAKAEEQLEREREALDGEAPAGEFKVKSKIIILLTDGDENVGDISASDAAELAARLGVKIYAIGIGGGESGPGSLPGRTFFQRPQYPFRTGPLREIAEATDGIFRTATDADSLRAVYEEIDRLETTEIDSVQYTSYAERYAGWALAGLGLLALELALGATLLRKTP